MVYIPAKPGFKIFKNPFKFWIHNIFLINVIYYGAVFIKIDFVDNW